MLIAAIIAWQHFGPAAVHFGDGGADQVRAGLIFNMVVTALVVLATAALATVVRRPLRWARPAAWAVLGVLGFALFTGLNAGVDPAGSTAGPGADPANRLYYDLVPGWYPSVHAALGLIVLATCVAVVIMLMRSSVADFYRPATTKQDPKWAAFVDRQQKLIAGENDKS
ncbi:hypothetical protein [Actinoplanes sp. NPDC026619]|uniref:hypothetical protein n=1 Tax=Actinoplanes sp. NPDC026619 TaxID=3155798 RepID=UPI0033C6788B